MRRRAGRLLALGLHGGFGHAASAATPLDAAVRQRVEPAVVLLLVEEGYGSGFALNAQGHIATNHHVVAAAAASRPDKAAAAPSTSWPSLCVLATSPSAKPRR